MILLFALVVMHELTHARVAQRYGIGGKSIVLLPIGGMAQMEEIPRDPRKEFTISVAGPLSNLVLGLVMLGVSFLFIDYGSITSPDTLHNQQQQIFAVTDLNVSPKWEINIGVGVGPTAGTDHLIVKGILGRRFDWGHHPPVN